MSRSRRIAAAGLAVGLLASAAALIMVLAPARQSAVGGGPESTSRVTPVTPALLALAKVEAPPYSPFTVRSADGTAARFTEAMTAYSRADFHRAADGLRAVVTADGGNVQAQFYLGVSLLMNRDAAAAAERFRAVIATGPSPFHDSSQLLLGKALIRTGDLDAALRALRQASEGAGPRAAEAAALEQQVETARSSLRR